MVTPTGAAPHIPFHLGPVKANTDTPTPTDFGAAGGYVQPPPGLSLPLGLPQPASNMSAAQQLKDRLTKGECSILAVYVCYSDRLTHGVEQQRIGQVMASSLPASANCSCSHVR